MMSSCCRHYTNVKKEFKIGNKISRKRISINSKFSNGKIRIDIEEEQFSNKYRREIYITKKEISNYKKWYGDPFTFIGGMIYKLLTLQLTEVLVLPIAIFNGSGEYKTHKQKGDWEKTGQYEEIKSKGLANSLIKLELNNNNFLEIGFPSRKITNTHGNVYFDIIYKNKLVINRDSMLWNKKVFRDIKPFYVKAKIIFIEKNIQKKIKIGPFKNIKSLSPNYLKNSNYSKLNIEKKINDKINKYKNNFKNNYIYLNKNKLVRTARYYIGRPYQWGGENYWGVDCSGFIQYVFKQIGYKFPRTAVEQFWIMDKYIDNENLQYGDLLFFKFNDRIDHVGIYMGNNKFIHAYSGAGKVTISRLDGRFLRKFYKGGRIN